MITKSSSSCTYHTRPQGMSVAAKQVRRTLGLRDCILIVLARQLLGLSPRRSSLYPGDWSLAVCVLDAGRSIAHFFLTFSLAAARLALATAF